MILRDDVDPSKPPVAYGLDSMIGTALRNWDFSTFGVDIPISDFMGLVLESPKFTTVSIPVVYIPDLSIRPY
ncbi:hypothetical protein F4679DRAFT_564174 [Xylaria curta]|nr:hypothetical protein F4679DRAFT_564174 [Xylaria curta]